MYISSLSFSIISISRDVLEFRSPNKVTVPSAA